MVLVGNPPVGVFLALADHQVHVRLGRGLRERHLVGSQYLASLCEANSCIGLVLLVGSFLVEHFGLELVLELRHLNGQVLDLVLVLGLFMLDSSHILDEVVALSGDFDDLLLVLIFDILELVLQVSHLLQKSLILLFGSSCLSLSINLSRLSRINLLPEVVSSLDVLDSLLEHEVDAIDGVSNVTRSSLEQITNFWHAVLLLSLQVVRAALTYLLDVADFVDELGDDKVIIISLCREVLPTTLEHGVGGYWVVVAR